MGASGRGGASNGSPDVRELLCSKHSYCRRTRLDAIKREITEIVMMLICGTECLLSGRGQTLSRSRYFQTGVEIH